MILTEILLTVGKVMMMFTTMMMIAQQPRPSAPHTSQSGSRQVCQPCPRSLSPACASLDSLPRPDWLTPDTQAPPSLPIRWHSPRHLQLRDSEPSSSLISEPHFGAPRPGNSPTLCRLGNLSVPSFYGEQSHPLSHTIKAF